MNNLKTVLMMFMVAVAPSLWAGEHITYFHNDALGSPVAATNVNGEVLWTEVYEPYGARINRPLDPNRLWYTGKSEETDLGLTYFGARWYAPGVGRFTGMDPKGLVAEDPYSFNRYAYANDNPYRYIDPDGNDSVAVVQGRRISTSHDSHSDKGGYAVYTYAVYHVPDGTPPWVAPYLGAALHQEEGSFEITWEARLNVPENRGTVLSSHSKIAEVSLSSETGYHIWVTDAASSADKLTQNLGEESITRDAVRLHWGGPDGSKGCGTTVNGLRKNAAEKYLIRNMPSLKRNGEHTDIQLPRIGDQ